MKAAGEALAYSIFSGTVAPVAPLGRDFPVAGLQPGRRQLGTQKNRRPDFRRPVATRNLGALKLEGYLDLQRGKTRGADDDLVIPGEAGDRHHLARLDRLFGKRPGLVHRVVHDAQ